MCLACPNAVATPSHLPRLVFLHDTLTGIASAVSEDVWDSDYRLAFEQLDHLLRSEFSDEERIDARSRVTHQEREDIELLLDRQLDA